MMGTHKTFHGVDAEHYDHQKQLRGVMERHLRHLSTEQLECLVAYANVLSAGEKADELTFLARRKLFLTPPTQEVERQRERERNRRTMSAGG